MSDRQVDSDCGWISWLLFRRSRQDAMEIGGAVAAVMVRDGMCELIL